jgi:hypothetical protein
MKLITQTQMANLNTLLGVLESMKDVPEEQLDSWFQPCGTHGCVAGEYFLKQGLDKVEVSLYNVGPAYYYKPKLSNLEDSFEELINHPEREFGHTLELSFEDDGEWHYVNVFGTSYEGTIPQRIKVVKHLIANSKVVE